jgi:hypothetical protein
MKRSDAMRRSHRSAQLALVAVLALGGTGYAATAGVHGHNAGLPTTTPPPQGHGNGVLCQGLSQQHVPGTPGTPFSNCVTGLVHGR